MKKDLLLLTLFASTLSLTSCDFFNKEKNLVSIKEDSFKTEKDFYESKECLSFKFDFDTKYNIKFNNAIINNKEFKTTQFKNRVIIKTDFKLKDIDKDFLLMSAKYTNVSNNKEYYLSMKPITTKAKIKIENEVEGTIENVDFDTNIHNYLLNDWEENKKDFYLTININTKGNIYFPSENLFLINDKLYNGIEIENESVSSIKKYVVKDIVNDIKPSSVCEYKINLQKIFYETNNSKKESNVNKEIKINFIQNDIKASNILCDENNNIYDAYDHKVNQITDSLSFSFELNKSQSTLKKLTINANKPVNVNLNQIKVKNLSLNNLYKYEFKINLNDLIDEPLLSSYILKINSLTLIFNESGNDTISEIPLNLETTIYTSYIKNKEDLINLNNKVGSYLILNDIDLDYKTNEEDKFSKNCLIENLKCELIGNSKVLNRTKSTSFSLIKNIDESGSISDLFYSLETFSICNTKYTLKKDGTQKERFNDWEFNEYKTDFSNSSVLCSSNYGKLKKVKVCTSISYFKQVKENHPLTYDGIIGTNHGELEDIDIRYKNIYLDGSDIENFDIRDFCYITNSNFGNINRVMIHETEKILFSYFKGTYKNTSVFASCKINAGNIKNIINFENFWIRMQIENNKIDFYTLQYYYYPIVSKAKTIDGITYSEIENYFVDGIEFSGLNCDFASWFSYLGTYIKKNPNKNDPEIILYEKYGYDNAKKYSPDFEEDKDKIFYNGLGLCCDFHLGGGSKAVFSPIYGRPMREDIPFEAKTNYTQGIKAFCSYDNGNVWGLNYSDVYNSSLKDVKYNGQPIWKDTNIITRVGIMFY